MWVVPFLHYDRLLQELVLQDCPLVRGVLFVKLGVDRLLQDFLVIF